MRIPLARISWQKPCTGDPTFDAGAVTNSVALMLEPGGAWYSLFGSYSWMAR